MRKDMFQVIIERPRLRGDRASGRRITERTERAFELAPKRLGMRRAYRRRKDLNENLAPLRRFLFSRVGKPWNAVRSEMHAVLSLASAVQKHVLDHVRLMVEENPVLIDGVPHRPEAFGGKYSPLRGYGRWISFYVCPRTGLLRATPCPRKQRPREDG